MKVLKRGKPRQTRWYVDVVCDGVDIHREFIAFVCGSKLRLSVDDLHVSEIFDDTEVSYKCAVCGAIRSLPKHLWPAGLSRHNGTNFQAVHPSRPNGWDVVKKVTNAELEPETSNRRRT